MFADTFLLALIKTANKIARLNAIKIIDNGSSSGSGENAEEVLPSTNHEIYRNLKFKLEKFSMEKALPSRLDA